MPKGWRRCKLGDLISGIEAGKSYAAESRPAEPGEYGVLKVSAVTWGSFRPEENKALMPGTEIRPQYQVHAGDVLISRANTAELVGAVVLVDRDYPRLLLSDKTLRLLFASDEVYLPYMVLALRSDAVRRYFGANATGTSASMRNLSQDKLVGAPIWLPPLTEQRRIVTKVDELLTICSVLGRKMEQSSAAQQATLQAILAHLGDKYVTRLL